ncbi:serine hydrolase domain-containing protein [Streptosporangium sp. CA-135522]|uniref:serine hydrolase domain-containing protein n=1 Tax=Streptosporangium sp. CA-135522 TaxID=3240072 RepID=UPI003D8A8383
MDIAERLSDLVHSSVRPGGPGLAIGVYSDGRLIHHAAAGMASVEFEVPIDTGTRFDIASMSKQFTAAAALLLCRDGRLSLDDDIRKHLPELKLSVPVSVAQCLRHTGGLREWLSLSMLAGRSLTRITQAQALAFVAGLAEVNFEPGTDFSYSNTGYILVTSAIERITGQSLRAFTAERMFAPLGMTDTHFRDDSQEPLARYAYGYGVSEQGVRRADTEECAVGDGMIVTSVADLGPWFGFLHDGRVLGADVRDALLERDDTDAPYALGIYHTTVSGQPAFGHAGGAPGYRSQLLFLPERGIGIAVLTNNTSVDPGRVGYQALRLAAGLPDEAEPALIADHAAAEALSGFWCDSGTGTTFQIEQADDGRITLTGGGHLSGTFALTSDGTWHGEDNRLHVVDGRIMAGSIYAPGRARAFLPCAAPVEGARPPAAVYLSPEVGTLATITDEGVLELGLSLVAPIEPAPDGCFAAGPVTLRPDGDDLLISLHGLHRLRFVRQPDGTRPVGVPPGLNLTT